MTYRPTKQTERFEPLAGAGSWRELTNEEYAALEAKHGDLSRWYERVGETDSAEPQAAREPKRKGRATAGGEWR